MNENMPLENPYPRPPWAIHGQGLIAFSFPSSTSPHDDWPEELAVQTLIQRRTLAGYHIAEYDQPLTLDGAAPWREWGNILGCARMPQGNGFWMNAIAVDSEPAQAGGKEIWGLNKFRGEIRWDAKEGGGRAELSLPEGIIALEWKEWGPVFGKTMRWNMLTKIDGLFCRYTVQIRALFQIARLDVQRRDLPAFGSLSPGKYWALRHRDSDVRMVAPAPLES
ncbi:MAG: hypothetical protein ACP5I1_04265 [Candidatus Hinthialibacter sp.]